MMTPMTTVLLYAAWCLVLPAIYATYRVPLVLSGKKRHDHWERGQVPNDPPVLYRMKAAHLNSLENFPIFLGIVAMAALMDSLAAIAVLAPWVLYLRLGQSLVHISGTSFVQILIRATLFVAQLLIMLLMIFKLIG